MIKGLRVPLHPQYKTPAVAFQRLHYPVGSNSSFAKAGCYLFNRLVVKTIYW